MTSLTPFQLSGAPAAPAPPVRIRIRLTRPGRVDPIAEHELFTLIYDRKDESAE